MTTVKRITDLADYTAVLPYASELFGIYQPLLGWKSMRIEKRLSDAYRANKQQLIGKLTREFAGIANVKYDGDKVASIEIDPAALSASKLRRFDSLVLEKIAAELPEPSRVEPQNWQNAITRDRIEHILKSDVPEFYSQAFAQSQKERAGQLRARTSEAALIDFRNAQFGAFEHQLQYELEVAGSLLHLVENKNFKALGEIFYASRDRTEEARQIIAKIEADDGAEAFLSIETIDPSDREQLRSVALSPISVVHLFRQYFFELDTFLGTPTGHVWPSPGSSVELIEVQTRREYVEKTLETTLDVVTRAEQITTQEDELSEAVKEDTQQDVKLGASVKASYASIEATSSFDYSTSQQRARETTHKQRREQTEKLSSEIRKNYKSTFKTVSEVTEISSTRYTMANTGDELINYELRRKMRQVGVQVQDIGTYLCWQTYVDDPGRELGLAQLIHIAKPPELGGLTHPEEIPLLQPFSEEKMVTIPFISIEGGADNEGEVYNDGVEVDNNEWFGDLEKIQCGLRPGVRLPKGALRSRRRRVRPPGQALVPSRRGPIANADGKARFVLHLEFRRFPGPEQRRGEARPALGARRRRQ